MQYEYLGNLSLLLLCALAGLILVLGSLFLLWKGRIYLDREGNSMSEIELPMGIKFKSQFPVLIMFLFGAALVAYPAHRASQACVDPPFHREKPLRMVSLKGKLAGENRIDIQVFAIVDKITSRPGQEVELRVPYLDDRLYVVRYTDVASGRLMDKEEFRLPQGKMEHELRGVDPSSIAQPDVVIEEERVPEAVVSQFNK